MRMLLMLALSATVVGCSGAPKKKVALDHGGTKRTLLAKKGEVRDALMALAARDPKHAVKEQGDGDVIEVEGVFTAYLEPGPLGDETDVELICKAGREAEKEWLDKLPEAVKYLALDHVPDLRSPLDEGPRAVLPPVVPEIDAVRRY